MDIATLYSSTAIDCNIGLAYSAQTKQFETVMIDGHEYPISRTINEYRQDMAAFGAAVYFSDSGKTPDEIVKSEERHQ